jgi:hypothetical protein
VLTKPSILLRLEGAVLLAVSIYLYWQNHFGWILFAILFLAPDLFMFGYLASVRVGAPIYNLAHTTFTPVLLILAGVLAPRPRLLAYGLIWIAHIGFDRLLGFGLKYPTQFKDTHLQHV